MGVAAHLNIPLDEYDGRIRTFIPGYEAMLLAAAHALETLAVPAPHVVDLGTGTGALAAACLRVRPEARITAIDADPDILELARQRLIGSQAPPSFVPGLFDEVHLPACDAIVGSLSLHHVRTAEAKQALYRRCREALSPGGLVVSADCCPAADPRIAALQHAAWRDHLRLTYSEDDTRGFFAAWADEDVYFPLERELEMMRRAGLAGEVIWRAGAMAVIAARA